MHNYAIQIDTIKDTLEISHNKNTFQIYRLRLKRTFVIVADILLAKNEYNYSIMVFGLWCKIPPLSKRDQEIFIQKYLS